MRGWSLSLGRYFGVDVRLHGLMVVLLPVLMLLSGAVGSSAMRGLGLWLLLLFAVLVRETARSVGSAAAGSPVNRLVLLPTGATLAMEETGGPLQPGHERLLALLGPLANFFAGITLALLMYSATSHINLFEQPWFGPAHLVRSAIWAQVLLGGLNLLPALPLDAGVLLRRQFRRMRGLEAGNRASAGLTQGVASLLILGGIVTGQSWLSIMGCSILLTGRAAAQAALATTAVSSVRVGDVMLREFATLSSSDTLQDAARRSVQSLHDVFPVVRGPLVVGTISRQALLAALRTNGNGYVQGAMNRTVQIASPDDPLMPALQRLGATGPQLLHVVREERLVGIVAPGHLSQTLGELGKTRRALGRDGQAAPRG